MPSIVAVLEIGSREPSACRQAGSVTGAQGRAEVLDWPPCDDSDQAGGGGFQSAWIAVHGPLPDRYIQVGWLRFCDAADGDTAHCSKRYAWSQYDTDGSHFYTKWGAALPHGSNYHYKVEWISTSNDWVTTYNLPGGTVYTLQSVDNSSLKWSKDQAWYMGETHNASTHMTGGVSNHTGFTYLRLVYSFSDVLQLSSKRITLPQRLQRRR